MDPLVALTMGRYLPALADVLIKAGGPAKLEMPFSDLLVNTRHLAYLCLP